MEKVESKFYYRSDTFELMYNQNNVKCYLDDENQIVLITNDKDEVLFKLTADSAQGVGLIDFKNV